MLNAISKAMCISAVVLTLSACEDHMVQRSDQAVGGKTSGGGGGGDRPGGFKQNPGESYPFPTVTFTEFIPSYDPFSYFKCHAWRIEWPWYDDDFDYNLIPGVLSVNSGELNSFNFLNSTVPSNTFNSTFSLFYGDRVEGAGNMWDELEYSFNTPGYQDMESVQFAKGNVSVKNLQDWVQERPKLFVLNWPGSTDWQVEYQEGDFIHFYLSKSDLYGGIRIVSMSPRIIEVYLALPNP
jgi:hypothetical protein